MLRLLLLLSVTVLAAGANAQTAEEAVTLVTQGLEAGRATGNICGDVQPPKVTAGSRPHSHHATALHIHG